MERSLPDAAPDRGSDSVRPVHNRRTSLGYRLGAILIILLATAIRVQGMGVLGTQNDEGVHITVAERVAAGDTVYRDLFENRTPAVEVLLAGLFRLTGSNVVLARLASSTTAALTIAGLVLCGKVAQRRVVAGRLVGQRQWPSNIAGWAAGLFFGLAPLAVFWARFVMLEHWQTAAATLAVAAALLATTKGMNRWWAVSGMMAAVAILTKQTGIIVVTTLAGYLLILQPGSRGRDRRWSPVAWLAGLVAVIVLFMAWLAIQGALSDFLRFLSAAERLDPTVRLLEKGQAFMGWMLRRPLSFLAVAGAVAVVHKRRWTGWLVLLWALAEVAALFGPETIDVSWGGFSHYAVPGLAALALLAGLGLAQVAAWTSDKSRGRKLLAAGFLVAAILTAGGWIGDLGFAITQREYPQPTFDDEMRIGHYAAATTSEGQGILVLGNASFYHWAARRPASRFFHLPAYLPQSDLWPEVETDLLQTLNSDETGALLVSRMHLEDRLSDSLKESLRIRWAPVAIFSYPYQRDVFLFQPRPDTAGADDSPLAVFEAGISLRATELRRLDEQTLAAELWWSAEETPDKDWTVFVHLIDENGQVLAQHDGVPEVGFRPTSGWAAGELVVDSHWLVAPGADSFKGARLAIGLYDPASGARSHLLNAPGEIDSYLLDMGQEAQ